MLKSDKKRKRNENKTIARKKNTHKSKKKKANRENRFRKRNGKNIYLFYFFCCEMLVATS